jgi:hypothetical protein
MTSDNPINVRLRGEETKGRLALMENRVSAGFEPLEPNGPIPEARVVDPRIRRARAFRAVQFRTRGASRATLT